jgi:hypothetical protein
LKNPTQKIFSKNFRKNQGSVTLPEGPSVERREPEGHQGPKEQSPRDQIPWLHGACSLGPQGVLGEGQVPRFILSPENQLQVFFKKNPVLHSCNSWISKFRTDFSNLFGEITPWYVTPPPIQLLFVLMLYMLSILLHLMSLDMLDKSMDLSFLVDIDA